METQIPLWSEMALRQVPNLVVLAGIVMVFLKHMSKRDELIQKVQERSIDAIDRNTSQSAKTEKVLDEVVVALVRVNGK